MLDQFVIEPKSQKDVETNTGVIQQLHTQLLENKPASQYLLDRGIPPEVWEEFSLGYLPLNGTNNREFMPLCGRIIIPLYDCYGVPICLAGRTLNKDSPCKYWHPSYEKKYHIWNLNRAKEHIVNKNFVVIVEGFMHVFGLWSRGIRNVVSLQGTTIQRERIPLLLRYTKTVIAIPDTDKAGQGGWRHLSKVLKDEPYNMSVFRLILPEEYNDIDEFFLNSPTSSSLPVVEALKNPWAKRNSPKSDTIEIKNKVLKTFKNLV